MTSIQPQISTIPVYFTPNYNAVKIDINNPEVKTQEPVEKPNYSKEIYSYPKEEVYGMPKQSIYAPVAESPITTPASGPNPVLTTTPIVPKPVVVGEPKVQAAPKQVVDVKTPEQITSDIDVNSIISKLNDSDYEVQAKTMAAIAQTVNTNSKTATELLDVKVIDTLLGIMTKDTSKLQGPTAEQLQAREKMLAGKPTTTEEQSLANVTTPMELAERNKQFSIYTIATLQNLYVSEIKKASNNVVPLTELPGAAGIVEQLKNNSNPMVRVSSIEALSYVERPEYKKDLTTLFSVAQNDQDKVVSTTAKVALEKLAQVPDLKEVQPEVQAQTEPANNNMSNVTPPTAKKA